LRGVGRKKKWQNALGLTANISATLNAARKTFCLPTMDVLAKGFEISLARLLSRI
jgi:hypothetical protein